MSLCPEAETRSRMTDVEFWEHVFNRPHYDEERSDTEAFWPYNGDRDDVLTGEPCPECGAQEACGYDAEGRPYIHVMEET
jgi:hypothetical protein